VYVPAADVTPGVLTRSEKRTTCPYKGEASYWHVTVGDRRFDDAAWSYEMPLAEAAGVATHVSFDGEGVETELDTPVARFTAGP
jgi:uncharacterized protein (DUF427 family)